MVLRAAPNKAVVLLSGGIDSSTVLALAHAEGCELYALSFDYGQRHARELESARMIADSFIVKRHVIMDFNMKEFGGSALTSEIAVPKISAAEQKRGSAKEKRAAQKTSGSPSSRASGSIPVTYVPARNTIFLSFALAWAEVLEAENVYIGANAVDYSGYPDCRPEYLKAYEKLANLATKAAVEGKITLRIKAPLLSLKKSEIIKKGIACGLDLALTWSCYDPQKIKSQIPSPTSQKRKERGKAKASNYQLRAEYVPCGECDSCRLRIKGFREAGIEDPLLLHV
jgi:7-cyano-7-deazaguanine synthase